MRNGRILFVAVFLLAALATASVEAAGRQVLRHRLDAMTRTLQAVDRLPATNRLHAALCLPLRNPAALSNLLGRIYDPTSPDYRHYLTVEEFTAQFGPTREDYAAVVAFAQAQGLRVTTTHPNRMLVDIEGATADFERAFHMTMRLYRHPRENRLFHAPGVAPSIDLDVPVLSVCGLDDFALPHPARQRQISAAQATPMNGSAPGGSLWGYDFRKAYAPGVTLTGAGQSVGLLQFDGYYASDIASYVSQSGLPGVPTLQNVLLDGFDGTPGVNNDEVALDIDMSISMAPGLTQVIVYEAGPNGSAIDILNRMATDNVAKQLSASWTWGTLDPGTDQTFQQFAAQGQSYFNASGDNDAYTGAIDAPADDPNITVVGGTTLTNGTGGAWSSEVVWNWGNKYSSTYTGTGGGISTTIAIPTWQKNVNMSGNLGSTAMRNLPDVAMNADNTYMIWSNGLTEVLGGTSVATPLWAGFTALINQQAVAYGHPTVGFLNPAIYALGTNASVYTTVFHDIATGNNFWPSSPAKFPATSGYDLCTGWGTPIGQPLIDALSGPADPLIVTPTVGPTAGGPVGGPFNIPLQIFALTNTGAVSLNWSCSSAATWLTVWNTNGTLLPGKSANVFVSLNNQANNLSTGVFNGVVNITDMTSGIMQSRTFSLRIPIVQNGGFETGDFSGWLSSGDVSYIMIDNVNRQVHTGTYAAALGTYSSLGYLAQTLPTVPGQKYNVSFWLYYPSRSVPNEFQMSWNGNLLYDNINSSTINSYRHVQLVATATGATSVLQFGFLENATYFYLDDVSVAPVSTSVTLTVQSAYGGVFPGSTNVLPGTLLGEQITNSLIINGTTQVVCTGGIVVGNSSTQVSPTNILLALTNNATLTWLWATNYHLSSASAGNGAIAAGSSTNGFYAAGAPVSVTATPNLGYYFAGWTGDTAAGNTSSLTLNLTMDQARSVVAHFALSPETLTIVSAYGVGTPPVGVYANGYGSVLANAITGVQIVGGTQYVSTGWALAGGTDTNGATAGAGTNVTLALTNNAMLTWLWTTNYWLATAAGANGSVNVAPGWQAVGITTAITALATQYYHFTNWTGSVSSFANPLNLLINGPKSVTANFAATMTSSAPVPVPYWWLAQYGWTNNFESVVTNAANSNGMPYWAEYVAGTDPTNPASVLAITGLSMQPGTGNTVAWPSVAGRVYGLDSTTNLLDSFTPVPDATNLPATPPANVYTNTSGYLPAQLFYRLHVWLP